MADNSWLTSNPDQDMYNFSNTESGSGGTSGGWDYSQGMPDSYWQGIGYDGNDFGSGQADAQGNSGQTPQGVSGWLSRMGYTTARRDGGNNTTQNTFLDKAGNPVNNATFTVANDDPEFWLAAMGATGIAGGGILGAMNVASGAPAALTIGQSTGLGALQGLAGSASTGTPTLKGALQGAMSGGLGYGIDQLNPAGYLGVTDTNLAGGINRGVTSAITSEAQGGNPIKSGIMGALPGAVNFGADKMGLFDGGYDSGGQSLAPWAMPGNSQIQQDVGTAGGYSPAPWAGDMSGGGGLPMNAYSGIQPSNQTGQQSDGFLDHIKSLASSIFGDKTGNIGGKGIGNWAEGLAGMYMANKQRQMANDYLNQIGNNRNAYVNQMRSNLARKYAAGGRRADIGGQEQALQASLAELDSRNAPAINQLQTNSLKGLGGMFQNAAWLGDKQGWFGDSPSNTTPLQPMSSTPYQPITLPDIYQSQTQLDPMDWNRQRRPNQFGG